MEHNFRVIVVGGGVAGITASHALQKAEIDHVVLERATDVNPPVGASIAIYPHGARILHQIGCLKAAQSACQPCQRFITRGPDGQILSDSAFFDHVKANHGQDVLLLERKEFLRVLYEGLPDNSYIRLGCQVRDIVENQDGIEVVLKDGTVERGDMVMGCDGVHSLVRNRMWDFANQKIPRVITAKEKTSIVTSWKCLVGMAPPSPEMGERNMTVVHDNGYSFLFLSQPDKLFFFVFFRLDQSTTWPQRHHYTDTDAEELAAKVASHPVCETLVFGEIWKKRFRGTLIPIEEGVLKHWSHGRIVLAGDSVHKVTPNIALGGNSTMESVVVLCNHLRQTLVAHGGGKPSRATLRNIFAVYQTEREARMRAIMALSSLITRVQAWDSFGLKWLATWVLPYQSDSKLPQQMAELIKAAPKLDYVDVDGSFARGKVSWDDEPVGVTVNVPPIKRGKMMALLSRSIMVYLAGAMTAVLTLVYTLYIL